MNYEKCPNLCVTVTSYSLYHRTEVDRGCALDIGTFILQISKKLSLKKYMTSWKVYFLVVIIAINYY